jgi:metal-responsive CopG/Arc/MetJ family transcriptional regulator
MVKRKTSIMIDEELWKEWTKFVVDRTGSARKLSEEIENALRTYMERA